MKRDLTPKLARWALLLQEYQFEIRHRSGKYHTDADFLSRNPVAPAEEVNKEDVQFFTPVFNLNENRRQDSEVQGIVSRLRSPPSHTPERRLRRAYRIHHGLLCHRGSQGWVPFVPVKLRPAVLHLCHDDLTAGHLGRDKTAKKILERYWWPGVRTDVAKYTASCVKCQSRKTTNPTINCGVQPVPLPETPFEIMGIDHLGPFPCTPDGNKYVLVAIDYLSKWVELRPVPNTAVDHVVQFLRQQVILRHGVPRVLVSDRASCFLSRQFVKEMELHGIHHAQAAPYHPQTNGLVERANRTISGILASYVNNQHNNWDQLVPYAAFAMNTAEQSTTAFTPFKIVYGRTPVLPGEAGTNAAWRLRAEEFSSSSEHRLRDVRRQARDALLRAQHRTQERTAPASPPTRIQSGDWVLVRRPLRKKGRAEKFLPRFIGPCEVLQQLGPVTFRVRNCTRSSNRTKATFTVHRSHLRHYIPRSSEF